MTRYQHGISAGVPPDVISRGLGGVAKCWLFSRVIKVDAMGYIFESFETVGRSLKGRARTHGVVKLPRDFSSFRTPTTQE